MKQQDVNKTNICNSQIGISAKKEHKKNSIYVIDLVEQTMKDQQLQEKTKKYGKVIDQKIRKDCKGKRSNIAIVTFSTKRFSRFSWNK